MEEKKRQNEAGDRGKRKGGKFVEKWYLFRNKGLGTVLY
jgi:hypothetical protein